jgi:phosphate transport system protein
MSQEKHTFTKFDDDLTSIRVHILEMCGLIEMQFKQSMQALLESNVKIARQVVDQDYSVNHLEVRIDSLCVSAIARQQPAASDLQSILIAMKFVMHLERIGDEAKKIARIAERLAHQNHLARKRFSRVSLDAELAQQRLEEVIDSFTRLDTFTAYKLLGSEELINEEFSLIFRDLVQSMTDHPHTISSSIEILFVAKAIERIGSHINHIANLVINASNRYSEI